VVLALAGYAVGFLVFSAVALIVLLSLVLLFAGRTDSAYDQIGRGGISRESDYARRAPGPAPGTPAAAAEREREMRQMLTARSERLERKGQPPLEIDAELARLLAGERAPVTRDAELVAEVRQLVVARNERRARQGLAPLDVNVEVERTIAELDS